MKEDIIHFVTVMRHFFVAFGCVTIPAFMVCAVFAFSGYLAFWFVAAGILVVFLTVYAVYTLKFTLGTAIGLEISPEVVNVKTKRKIFTYDVKEGCVSVKTKRNKFICVFETQSSREKFTLYRRVPFAKYREQFTKEEILRFYPAYKEQ